MEKMTQTDKKLLKKAYDILENPGFRIKLMNALGKPIEKSIELLPKFINKQIEKASKFALTKAADVALFTIPKSKRQDSYNWTHRVAVWGTGFFGGFGGITTIFAEVPISTMIMLRSIMDIAKSEGEDLSSPEARLAALQVFALGGNSASDDLADTAYYTVRMGMAAEVKSALDFLAKSGGKLADKNAPVIVKLISKIASRFGITITEKSAAQAMPFIGGGIGVIINDIFISHYQDMAQGHFLIRRLERKYGKELVKETYEGFKHS